MKPAPRFSKRRRRGQEFALPGSRARQIIEVFKGSTVVEMTAGEIAAALKVNISLVGNALRRLIQRDYLVQDVDRGPYRLKASAAPPDHPPGT